VVPIETYVAAVVSREAPPKFFPEALKAMAVAVRTYAVGMSRTPRNPDYDMVASVEDQVFEGVDDVAPPFREAVEATRGRWRCTAVCPPGRCTTLRAEGGRSPRRTRGGEGCAVPARPAMRGLLRESAYRWE